MKTGLIRFTNSFAKKRAAKLAVFFIIAGTSLLLPIDASAVQTGSVQVICADPSGAQRTFTIGWDNSQPFFEGKGQISRFFCEGGYAGNYKIFISNNLSDSTLDYYQGLVPIVTPTPPPSPTSADTSTATQEPAPVPVESPTVQVDSPTSTNQSQPTVQDSATVNQSETLTASVESPTATALPETSTVDSQPSENQDSQTAQIVPPVSDSSTVVAPVEPSSPIQDSAPTNPQPAPVTQEPLPSLPVEPSPTPPDPIEPEPAEVIPAPEPEPTPVELEPQTPEPELPQEIEPESPVDEEQNPLKDSAAPIPTEFPSTAPVSINSVDIATLAPNTPVQLENGVILTAEVVVALTLLENPSELIGAIFTNPAQALMALANVGADLSPEVREKAQNTILASVIAGGIATQSAVSAAGAAAYRRNP